MSARENPREQWRADRGPTVCFGRGWHVLHFEEIAAFVQHSDSAMSARVDADDDIHGVDPNGPRPRPYDGCDAVVGYPRIARARVTCLIAGCVTSVIVGHNALGGGSWGMTRRPQSPLALVLFLIVNPRVSST